MINKTVSLTRAFKSRSNPEDWGIVARFFWRIVLVSVGAGTCIGVGLGLWQLHSVLVDRPDDVLSPSSKAELIDPAKLHDALHAFDLRKQRFDELRGVRTSVGATSSPASSTSPTR